MRSRVDWVKPTIKTASFNAKLMHQVVAWAWHVYLYKNIKYYKTDETSWHISRSAACVVATCVVLAPHNNIPCTSMYISFHDISMQIAMFLFARHCGIICHGRLAEHPGCAVLCRRSSKAANRGNELDVISY